VLLFFLNSIRFGCLLIADAMPHPNLRIRIRGVWACRDDESVKSVLVVGFQVFGPGRGIFFGCCRQTGDLIVVRHVPAFGDAIVDSPEYGDAPTAAGPGAEAFRHLGRSRQVMPAGVVVQLSQRDVIAVADLVVGFHFERL
jgi:hypothetical protein